VQRPYNPNAKRIAEMMQSDLAKVGINAKLVTYEWGEYRKRAQQGEPMTVQLGLDWRQRRSRQLLLPLGLHRRQAGGPEHRQMVRRRFRQGADRSTQHD
jgi:dipeptide transport system substrate-binding protein